MHSWHWNDPTGDLLAQGIELTSMIPYNIALALSSIVRLFELLSIDNIDTRLSGNNILRAKALVPLTDVTMHMPAVVGDYTDFYRLTFATNVV